MASQIRGLDARLFNSLRSSLLPCGSRPHPHSPLCLFLRLRVPSWTLRGLTSVSNPTASQLLCRFYSPEILSALVASLIVPCRKHPSRYLEPSSLSQIQMNISCMYKANLISPSHPSFPLKRAARSTFHQTCSITTMTHPLYTACQAWGFLPLPHPSLLDL